MLAERDLTMDELKPCPSCGFDKAAWEEHAKKMKALRGAESEAIGGKGVTT